MSTNESMVTNNSSNNYDSNIVRTGLVLLPVILMNRNKIMNQNNSALYDDSLIFNGSKNLALENWKREGGLEKIVLRT